MKRGAVAVIWLIVGLVLGLLAGRLKPAMAPPGGGPAAQTPRDRGVLVVLVKASGGGCQALKLDEHRAFRNDKVVWDVRDQCGVGGQTVEIRWGSSGSPTGDALSGSITGGKVKLQGKMDKVPPKQGEGDEKVWEYPYEIYLQGTLLVDPRLEIDP